MAKPFHLGGTDWRDMENVTKKPTPLPRNGRYYGMKIHNVINPDGSWLEGEEFCYPNGEMTRRCYAHCEDGKLRVVQCGIPDTFFSIPAYARIQGKRIKGFISSSEQGFKFTAYKGE